MKKFIKMQKFGTSENKTYFFWNFKLAENFFAQKPESFNAVFAGEVNICKTDYDIYYNDIELTEIDDGIFIKKNK